MLGRKREYGDRLGNGVYLYKIVTKLNGNDIERSGNSADKFFVKRFWKDGIDAIACCVRRSRDTFMLLDSARSDNKC